MYIFVTFSVYLSETHICALQTQNINMESRVRAQVKTEKRIFLEDNKESQIEQQPRQILHLKDAPNHRVSWTEQTVDNEHMNRKKSNLCCIYHRPGQTSSDTCTSDDEGNALERDRHTKHKHKSVCSKKKCTDPQSAKDGKKKQ